jgi:hypothetical protein
MLKTHLQVPGFQHSYQHSCIKKRAPAGAPCLQVVYHDDKINHIIVDLVHNLVDKVINIVVTHGDVENIDISWMNLAGMNQVMQVTHANDSITFAGIAAIGHLDNINGIHGLIPLCLVGDMMG